MIRIFRMDDNEWWAGESLSACVDEGRRQCGPECYPDDPEWQRELSDEEMRQLTFVDEDDIRRTFADELERRISAGERFPQAFAAENF